MNAQLLSHYMGLYERRCDSIADSDRYIAFIEELGAIGGPQLSDAEVEKCYWMVVNNPDLTSAEKLAGLDLLSVYIVNCTADGRVHPLLDVIAERQGEYLFPTEPVVLVPPVTPALPAPRPWDQYVAANPVPRMDEYLALFGIPVGGAA